MVIRRSFGFCASHIVRNCTSKRCSSSIHGHNYKVEIFVQANSLDSAGMILDFGIFKNQIADFIDGFDHSHHFWDAEQSDFIDFITQNSARYVKLSVNPSAENYALLLLFYIDKILEAMEFGNSEGDILVSSVRVHETDHGYAEAFREDLSNPKMMKHIHINSIYFSEPIMAEWKNPIMLEELKNYYVSPHSKPFKNITPPHQIKIQC
ncbi:6-pyruvoyl trahydropterin synthase family protein [Helicobacter cappadocius]|uniref:6-carboxy-5,6,7,8-tetrahydropterin synthase n=1 Tax=Helicobacter cappadocius TaxID=3063998 RepID=A0AA90PIG2_9HELI|nr:MULTISPECIES: 6-carboxytetrahydropterin synthase [unclassified Helicobacter]MDO7252559.1 6-carboxytetrahydropterin synthase [Helicobacter sp. faydin-H75]MDP2538426.1 6-carboxytetrahydropterin synthase [Helicobacter sp. faydin-H76]